MKGASTVEGRNADDGYDRSPVDFFDFRRKRNSKSTLVVGDDEYSELHQPFDVGFGHLEFYLDNSFNRVWMVSGTWVVDLLCAADTTRDTWARISPLIV